MYGSRMGSRRHAILWGLAATVGGCASLPRPAAQQIQQADRAYLEGRYPAAEQLLSPVIAEHPDQPEVAEALYLRGLCRLKSHHPAQAEQDLHRALELSSRKDLSARTHAQLGNLHFERQRYAGAVEHYSQAYDALPDRAPKGRIGYQYGVALQRVGRFPEARTVFSQVVRQFSPSAVAKRAERKRAWPHDYFSIQCGAFHRIANAHQQARMLARQGFHAVAFPEAARAPNTYYVRVGRYGSFRAATRDLARLRAIVPEAFIVP